MGEQFRGWKKRLDAEYVRKDKTPDFTGPHEEIKDQWDEIVKYKTLEEAKKKLEKIR